jgi:thiol-disulfide isomerase/thioredoxin
LEVGLEPAEPIRGVVVDAAGEPVAEATVCLGTHTQHLDIAGHDLNSYSDVFSKRTGSDGAFTFPAQYEPYAILVIHDTGYAEAMCDADEQPGQMQLDAWSSVEGRLMQDGQPLPGQQVRLRPLRPRFPPRPRISEDFWTQTDAEGHYQFKRVPPVKASVDAYLSVWEESPLRSSQSVPVDLPPGERRQVDLGGRGVTVTGSVRLAGEAAGQIDLHYSLNYLLRMTPGIEPPPELAAVGFDWRDGWSQAWTNSEEGMAYQQTLHHYFVKLASDGSFRISGVPAGKYQLAFKIYEPPTEGCLVYPVGTHVEQFAVNNTDVESGVLDLGEVEIAAVLGPKPGDPMPNLEFFTADGTQMRLSELRGRRVLLDFWATWCGPCVAALPKVRELYDEHAANSELVVLGMNMDVDQDEARQFIADRDLPWTQALLGDWTDTPILGQLGISSVPAYFLIDEQGVLVERSFQLETILEKLNALER